MDKDTAARIAACFRGSFARGTMSVPASGIAAVHKGERIFHPTRPDSRPDGHL